MTAFLSFGLYTPYDWIGLALIAVFVITRDAGVRRWLGLD
jgi:hypothetical protein